MSLRRKSVLSIGISVVLLLVGLLLFSRLFLLGSFLELEAGIVREHTWRVINEYESENNHFHTLAIGWAHWDDTFNFARGQYADYVARNLDDYYLLNEHLDVIALLDAEGHILYATTFENTRGEFLAPSAEVTALLTPDSALLQAVTYPDGLVGLVMLEQGPLMVAAVPILRSDGRGAAAGTLVFGRWLDAAERQLLAQRTRFDLELQAFDSAALPADFATVQGAVLQETIVTRVLNEQMVAGYTLLRDISGAPAYVLRVCLPRAIYAQGERVLFYFVLFMIGAFALLALIAWGILERGILARVARLDSELRRIRQSGDFALRVSAAGQDELSSLALSTNAMLESLANSHQIVQQALDVREQTLRSISHDARTPLSVITMYAEMLQREMHGSVNPKQSEVLTNIRASAFQLLGFINNLLDDAQLSAGKLTLIKSEFMLADLLSDVRLVTQPLADKKGLTLTFDCEADLPPILYGDVTRLTQIVTNLVTNAIKYTESGYVRVRSTRSDPQQWTIFVEDSGIGIDDTAQRLVFEAFWQSSGKPGKVSGVGLGLSIVKQLTEIMGGTVRLQSTPGKGSVFSVCLPLESAPVSAAVAS
ncbi:MAG: hypothetical protein HXY40_08310 [Chloroflexi bacterium]|nr:hypothetical protein [Chloroflexota bacterium]